MSVELACPACGAVNAFTEEHAGRVGKCGQCQTPLYIPRREEMPSLRPRSQPPPRGGGLVKILLLASALLLVAVVATTGVLGYLIFFPPSETTALGTGKETKDPFLSPALVQLEPSRTVTQTSALDADTSAAVFKFKAPTAGTVLAYVDPVDGSKLDGHLFALDSQRKELTQNGTDPDRRVSMIQFPVTIDQDYFVKVTGFDGSTGKFKLRIAHVSSVGGDFSTALEVRLNKAGTASQSWQLEKVDEINVFRLTAPFDGVLSVNLTYPAGSLLDGRLYAYDSNSPPRAIVTQNAPASFFVEKGRSYYIMVASWAQPLAGRTRTGPYTLKLKIDKATGGGPGKDFVSATKVYFNAGFATVKGQIKSDADVECYLVQPPKAGILKIDVFPEGLLDPEFQVFDAAKVLIGGTINGQRFFDPSVVALQSYYVKVGARPLPAPGLQRTGSFTLNFSMDTGGGGIKGPGDGKGGGKGP
jgi:hypothetical protein